MNAPRKGRQTPTQAVTLPYDKTHGADAIALYNATGRIAKEWQELLAFDIMAVNDDGLSSLQEKRRLCMIITESFFPKK